MPQRLPLVLVAAAVAGQLAAVGQLAVPFFLFPFLPTSCRAPLAYVLALNQALA